MQLEAIFFLVKNYYFTAERFKRGDYSPFVLEDRTNAHEWHVAFFVPAVFAPRFKTVRGVVLSPTFQMQRGKNNPSYCLAVMHCGDQQEAYVALDMLMSMENDYQVVSGVSDCGIADPGDGNKWERRLPEDVLRCNKHADKPAYEQLYEKMLDRRRQSPEGKRKRSRQEAQITLAVASMPLFNTIEETLDYRRKHPSPPTTKKMSMSPKITNMIECGGYGNLYW